MEEYDFGISKLPAYLSQVDRKIKSIIPKQINGVSRLLHSRGKRIRPSLVIATAYYSGKKIDNTVITAASAVELVHMASLVHDDILDNGTMRWGVPTINSTEGASSALLAGDYLFAKGCSLAASVSAEAGLVMSETIAKLCIGQAEELKDQYNLSRSVTSLNSAIHCKTSSMFVASCTLGGLVSGLNSQEILALIKYAENFGLAFQYMDDVNDFTKSFVQTGKSASNDVRNGNYTFPVILSLKGADKTSITKLLLDNPVSTENILDIFIKHGSIDLTLAEIMNYKNKSIKSLAKLSSSELIAQLKNFIQAF